MPDAEEGITRAKKLLAVTDEYLEIRDKPLTEEARTERSRLLAWRSFGERNAFNQRSHKGDEKPIMTKEQFEQDHTIRSEEPEQPKQPEAAGPLLIH